MNYVISSHGKAPHVRHTATLNAATTPDGLRTTLALTVCGRTLHNPRVVDNVSLLFTDGTVYMTPCQNCGVIPCCVCGGENDVSFAPSPYALEVNDDDTPRWMCGGCRQESADDI
jgi:hypothetical protein